MEIMRWLFPILVGVWKVSEGHYYINDLVTFNQAYNSYKNPISPQIVGGERAYLGEIPYQLSLRRWGKHFCGASLIQVDGHQIAITAAHCLANKTHLILAGGTIKSFPHIYQQARRVVGNVIHEDYDPNSLKNDIAVLFLKKPFKLNRYVNTISLPNPDTTTLTDVLVSGWGLVYSPNGNSGPVSKNFNTISKHLRKVRLPTVSTESCKKSYVDIIPIDDSQLCAGSKGKSICIGDSGGPAKSIDGNYLAGIISASKSCGDSEEFPGVFTNVSYFISWIRHAVSIHIPRHSIYKEEN